MISFGSDPEFILIHNEKPISAIGVVPGTTKARYSKDGSQFYYDNVLAECAIKPGRSIEEVINNFRQCFQNYAEIVKPYKLETKPYAKYPSKELMHKDARKAGCKKDHCAYDIQVMVPPQMEIKYEKGRSAGGHVHIGHDGYVNYKIPNSKDGFIGAWDTIKVLDIFLGYTSLFMDCEKGTKQRKELFGRAGRYRKTSYGIEYRTLSNFWLKSPKLVRIIHTLSEYAMAYSDMPSALNCLWDFDEDKLFTGRVRDAYKFKYDVDQLRKAIDTHNPKAKINSKDMILDILSVWAPDIIDDIIQGKLHSDQFDFYKEWEIEHL